MRLPAKATRKEAHDHKLSGLEGKYKKAQLLYSNRDTRDVVFAHELRLLARKRRFEYHDVLTGAKKGRSHGRIDAVLVQKLVPDAKGSDFYICGPTGMIRQLAADLKRAGVARGQIHFERFSLH